jgi:hypothetical protein
MVFCRSAFAKFESSLKSSPASFHIVAVLQLLFGLAVVHTCCISPPTALSDVLAVAGWILIARALLCFFLPKLIFKTIGSTKWNVVRFVLSLGLGIALSALTFV